VGETKSKDRFFPFRGRETGGPKKGQQPTSPGAKHQQPHENGCRDPPPLLHGLEPKRKNRSETAPQAARRKTKILPEFGKKTRESVSPETGPAKFVREGIGPT